MKARGAMIQGALAAAGLLVAFATWQREPEKAPGEVDVAPLKKGDLTAIRYENGPKWVEVVREGDPAKVFVTVFDPPPAPRPVAADAGTALPGDGGTPLGADGGVAPPDGGTATVAEAPPAPAPAPRRFRGNEAAERLFEKLSPPRASRALGALDEAKRKELGLDQTSRRLELRARRDVHAFLAAVPPFGLGTAYLEDTDNKKVFLIQAAPLNELDGAQTRLVERRLHRFELEQVDAVTFTLGQQSYPFVRATSKEPVAQLKLAPKGRPDAVDETVTTWHDRFWRMIVADVLPEGQEPPGGAPTLELRAEYRARDDRTGFVEVGRSGGDYFARSEQTAGWVKLYAGAADILKEAPRVLGSK